MTTGRENLHVDTDNGFIGDFFIQYKCQPRIFKLYDTVSKTQRVNRMGYTAAMLIINKLGYSLKNIYVGKLMYRRLTKD